MGSSHRGLRRRVAALALEVVSKQVWDTGPAEWVRRSNPFALGLLFTWTHGTLPKRSKWFKLKGQDGSTWELKMVLLQRSRWFLSESPRWFYFRGQEGSVWEFKVQYMILSDIRCFYLKGQDVSTWKVTMVLLERSRWFYLKGQGLFLKGQDGSTWEVKMVLP